jgi:hypothetical protein
MLGEMLLQARDGHCHLLCQTLLFRPRELPEPRQPPEPVTSLQELAFEPSMLRAAYRKGRKREHGAPVENDERQNSTGAKKKQILFRVGIEAAGGFGADVTSSDKFLEQRAGALTGKKPERNMAAQCSYLHISEPE